MANQPYVIPDECTTWIDMRLVPPTAPVDAEKIVEQGITTTEKQAPGVKGNYTMTGDRPAISSHTDTPLLAAVKEATKKVTGKPADLTIFTGYTDSVVVVGKTGNINCASYEPGSLEIAHRPNEFVPLKDIEWAHAVFRELLLTQGWNA